MKIENTQLIWRLPFNALSPLVIPSYDGSGEVVHPSVLHFQDKWNGFYYWMAFTPYKQTNEKYENPSIVVSNDGQNWIQLEGLRNPIIEKPEDGHLSDPNLFLTADKRLFMFYRKRYRFKNGIDYDEIFEVYSLDGVHWTLPKSVLIGDKGNGPAQLLSPAIAFYSNQYYLYTVNNKKESIQLRVSTNLEGIWSNPEDILLIKNLPDNIIPWHINVIKYQKYFEFIVVMKDRDGIEPDTLYYGRSNNGRDILLCNKPILCPSKAGWDSERIYQGSFVPIIKSEGFSGYYLYYSARGKNKVWKIGRTMIVPDQLEIGFYRK